MFTLGAVADLSLKQRTLDWALKSGEVKTQDTFYPIGSVASNAVGAEMAWKYFQEVHISQNALLNMRIHCCTRVVYVTIPLTISSFTFFLIRFTFHPSFLFFLNRTSL